MRPGDGMNERSGSSAITRHSMAWPCGVSRRCGSSASFSPRAEWEKPVVAIGEITGVQPRVAVLIGEGANRVFAGGRMKVAGAADLWLDLRVAPERAKDGRRTVRVGLGARSAGAMTAPSLREFRTVLSEPINEEQWRAVGEAAAYRVAADLATTRVARPTLRIEPTLQAWPAVAPSGAFAAEAEPLGLRLEERIAPR